MKKRNSRFGCPRIAEQINLVFGADINKDIVRRVLKRHYRPGSGEGGPSWLTFLGNMKNSLWSLDLFRCESITLRSYWVMVVMDQFTRRIIGFAVTAGDVDGPALCRMFNEIISQKTLPKRMSMDNDPLFRYHRWKANLRILDIEPINSVSYVPVSHPFVERLIGTVRREYLDCTLFWNSTDLKRKLTEFQNYYNQHRSHSSLRGATPSVKAGNLSKARLNITSYGWASHCRGIFCLPVAV